MSRQRKQSEETNHRQADNRRCHPLARRCSAKNFQLIYLLVYLHNYVRIDQQGNSVKKRPTTVSY